MPIPLISEIIPKNNGDFALLDDSNIRGGFRVVNNLTERNAIPADRRKIGMKVFVISTDNIYTLENDLSSWTVDTTFTQNLQSAYNGGAQIITATGIPVWIDSNDLSSRIFQITSNSEDILAVSGDKTVEFFKSLKGKEYTTSITSIVASNTPNAVIDSISINEYRAVQYAYTCSNSDNSGYETGQVHLIHDGSNISIYSSMNSAIGVPCGINFSSIIDIDHNMTLLASTDNSGSFSRILCLFKVALH